MWIQLAFDAYVYINSCMVSVVRNQKWIHGFWYVLIFWISIDKLNLCYRCCGPDKLNGICVCDCYYDLSLSFFII